MEIKENLLPQFTNLLIKIIFGSGPAMRVDTTDSAIKSEKLHLIYKTL